MPPSCVQNVQCHSTLQCCDVSLRQVRVSPCPQAISACEKCQHWKWALMLMEVGKWKTIIPHLFSAWNGTHLENCYRTFFCLDRTLSNCSCRFLTTQMWKPKSRFTSSRRYRPTHKSGGLSVIHPTGNGCGEDPKGCAMAHQKVLMVTNPTGNPE